MSQTQTSALRCDRIRKILTAKGYESGKLWLKVIGINNTSGQNRVTYERYCTVNEANLCDSGYHVREYDDASIVPTFGSYRMQVLDYVNLSVDVSYIASVKGFQTKPNNLQGAWQLLKRNQNNVVCSSVVRIPYVASASTIAFRANSYFKGHARGKVMNNFRNIVPYNIFANAQPVLDTLSKLFTTSVKTDPNGAINDDTGVNLDGGSRRVTISSNNGIHNVENLTKVTKSVRDALSICIDILTDEHNFIQDMDDIHCRILALKNLGEAVDRPESLQPTTITEKVALVNYIISAINTGFILTWWNRFIKDGEHEIFAFDMTGKAMPSTSVEVLDYILWTSYTACGLYTNTFSAGESSKPLLLKLANYFENRRGGIASLMREEPTDQMYRRTFFSMFQQFIN
jgi:hypothetical protein